jgi:hypothetical protein
MKKVYLSSTYEDLVEHRKAVYDALRQLRLDVLSMEDYGASDERPLDRCLADVAGSDVYVGVIAWRYGFVPPGEKKAITQLEYEQAGKAQRPRLVFLTADDAPWPPNRMDPDLDAVRRLRAQLRLDHVVAFFRTADDLAREVSVAVANLLSGSQPGVAGAAGTAGADAEFLRRNLGRMASDFDSSSRFYWCIGCTVFALGVLFLLIGALLDRPLLAIGAIVIIACALIPFTTMMSARRKRDVLGGYAHALEAASPPPDMLRSVQQFLAHQFAG